MEGDQEWTEDDKQTPSRPLVRRVRNLLYRNLYVGVTDGRYFLGKFHCLDKQGNLILYDAVEHRQISTSSSSAMEQRSLVARAETRSRGLGESIPLYQVMPVLLFSVAMVECERYSPQTTRVIKAG